MANEAAKQKTESTGQKPEAVIANGKTYGKYKIYRKSKKTAVNPEGRALLTITRAESIEDALAIGRAILDEEYGTGLFVEPMPE